MTPSPRLWFNPPFYVPVRVPVPEWPFPAGHAHGHGNGYVDGDRMPKLRILRGTQLLREMAVDQDSVSIGRTPENDVFLNDALISRKHCSIIRRGNGFILYDLGSSNRTFVNDAPAEVRALVPGDRIRVGEHVLVFEDEAYAQAPPQEQTRRRKQAEAFVDALYGAAPIVKHVDDVAEAVGLGTSQGASLPSLGGAKADPKGAGGQRYFILFKFAEAVQKARSLPELLDTGLQLMFQVIQAERGNVILLNRRTGGLLPVVTRHRTEGKIEARTIPVSSTITQQVIRERIALVTSDALQDSRFQAGLSIVQHNIRSALCVPLWEREEIFGVIYLDNVAKTYAFTQDDLELGAAMANLMAIHIMKEEYNSKLKQEELRRARYEKYHSPDIARILTERPELLEPTVKEVTVCFADVAGSTTLAETMPPAAVGEWLGRFLKTVTDVVMRHGGHVNKYIGDSVLAVYGWPLDMPDHPRVAVRAAVEILRSVRALNESGPGGPELHVRIGIQTGEVVAGDIGPEERKEYTVLGDTVNTAARLQKLAELDAICVSETVHRRLGNEFRSRDLGGQKLKGRGAEIRCYEIRP